MIELLNVAILNVEERYFFRKERDFAYELYHQLRLLKLPSNTEVSCEHPKARFTFSDTIFNEPLIRRNFFSDEINENKRICRYPDLLIHEFDNRKQQLLAIEIKRGGAANQIKKDLAKLIVYCRGRLKYQKGVLIIIQPRQDIDQINELPDILEMLRNYPEIEMWAVWHKKVEILNTKNI